MSDFNDIKRIVKTLLPDGVIQELDRHLPNATNNGKIGDIDQFIALPPGVSELNISPMELQVLLWLYSKPEKFTPHYDVMARELSVSRDSISKSLNGLEAAGLITRYRRKGTTNNIVIRLPGEASVGDLMGIPRPKLKIFTKVPQEIPHLPVSPLAKRILVFLYEQDENWIFRWKNVCPRLRCGRRQLFKALNELEEYWILGRRGDNEQGFRHVKMVIDQNLIFAIGNIQRGLLQAALDIPQSEIGAYLSLKSDTGLSLKSDTPNIFITNVINRWNKTQIETNLGATPNFPRGDTGEKAGEKKIEDIYCALGEEEETGILGGKIGVDSREMESSDSNHYSHSSAGEKMKKFDRTSDSNVVPLYKKKSQPVPKNHKEAFAKYKKESALFKKPPDWDVFLDLPIDDIKRVWSLGLFIATGVTTPAFDAAHIKMMRTFQKKQKWGILDYMAMFRGWGELMKIMKSNKVVWSPPAIPIIEFIMKHRVSINTYLPEVVSALEHDWFGYETEESNAEEEAAKVAAEKEALSDEWLDADSGLTLDEYYQKKSAGKL